MNHHVNIWFSPRKILLRYAQKEAELGEKLIKEKNYKQMREARSVALMLFGIIKIQKKPYWMQLVDPKERTPDIRTMRLVNRLGKSDWCEYQDVEVVTLTNFTKEASDEFIKRTKLATKKAYPRTTTILCHIDRNIKTKSWATIHSSLKTSKPRNDVLLLGRTDPTKQIYQLARVHPRLDMLTIYNVLEEAKKFPGKDTRRLIRGEKKISFREPVNYEPF